MYITRILYIDIDIISYKTTCMHYVVTIYYHFTIVIINLVII